MAFLRVVEVFPPLFPFEGSDQRLNLAEKTGQFVEDVRGVRSSGDLFLVADVKKPDLAKLSTVEAASILQSRAGVRAAPVIVVRDMNRLQFLSTALTAVSLGLDSLMVVWGDRYPASAKASNVRDFPSLAEALQQVDSIRRRARSSVKLLAPIDLRRLSSPKGVARAKDRLQAGADLLLAQPPTTDAGGTFESHSALLEDAGLKEKVLLNVFPFRDEGDVKDCELKFGWRFPGSLHAVASEGASKLRKSDRDIVGRIRRGGFPGVYVSTRGSPSVAAQVLS